MWFGIISIFPELFVPFSRYGVIAQAIKKRILQINTWNPRNFVDDYHRTVDDRPYGGGPGMLMKIKPLHDAIICAKKNAEKYLNTNSFAYSMKVIYLSPKGKRLNQTSVTKLANNSCLILVAGRYEGIDERLVELDIDEEWSVGDYILSGGELPAMLLIDAIARLIPGVIGNNEAVQEDSFATGLLEYPQYTRPAEFAGKKVPQALLSGDHRRIATWKLKQSLGQTWLKRPDLLANRQLTVEENQLLQEFISENEIID